MRTQKPRRDKLNKTFSMHLDTIAMLKAECERTGKSQKLILEEALKLYINKDEHFLTAIRQIVREELDR